MAPALGPNQLLRAPDGVRKPPYIRSQLSRGVVARPVERDSIFGAEHSNGSYGGRATIGPVGTTGYPMMEILGMRGLSTSPETLITTGISPHVATLTTQPNMTRKRVPSRLSTWRRPRSGRPWYRRCIPSYQRGGHGGHTRGN
ncbi:hypothetical protein C8Q74DRAFT_675849 [Fomes fomentarius]|nr:hypothetical protein C8Q74DRAFT_675849 [Fomes fomentarius]